jgi:hypothetical protein
LPQLILKTSWVIDKFRFQAKIVESDPQLGGVVCSRSFVSVHTEQQNEDWLKAACVIYNSNLANYYLLLTSGRFAFSRTEPLIGELRSIPLPEVPFEDVGDQMTRFGELSDTAQIDELSYRLFDLNEAERILIEDLVTYTLPDYKLKSGSPGRQATHRLDPSGRREPELTAFCKTFCRVMKAAYGDDKRISAIIFSEEASTDLPVRLVEIQLNCRADDVRVERLRSNTLRNRLTQFYHQSLNRHELSNFFGRCARSYETKEACGQTSLIIRIIKPDEIRYWTRSMAMREADAVVADITLWHSSQDRSSMMDQEARSA